MIPSEHSMGTPELPSKCSYWMTCFPSIATQGECDTCGLDAARFRRRRMILSDGKSSVFRRKKYAFRCASPIVGSA
ncbi:hypothetical protein KQX54_015732 [Cotesia glomerata]|uniref:Uncharacterized protein n=2 Tax=Cotesia glomerata TaxID=32391 RepID=A0AAV7IM56_COTGL|nr:hypothetical protein KQX54_015732 [Cotesia glomerata]